MSLDITPEAVNQFVANAILKSALGDAVKKSVDEAVAKLGRSWDNPIDTVVKGEISRLVTEVIRETYAESLKAQVTEKLAGKITDEVVGNIIDKAIEKYNY